MTEDRDNPLALSSKRSCQNQTDYKRELERLRADLEVEKIQTLWACGQLGVELRCLREEAEREHKRAVRELAARRFRLKDRTRSRYLLAKEGKIKNGGQHNKVQSTGEAGFYLDRRPSKLEQLLLTLYEKINGKQAGYKSHHGQEFELEKAIFLCRLLEAHGRLLQGTRSSRPPSYFSKKQVWDNSCYPCQPTAHLTCSRAQLRTSSYNRKSKPDQEKQLSSSGLQTARPCTSTAVRSACQISSLKIYHPYTIHAVEDNHPSHWAESSSSDESSSTKCTKRNMEAKAAFSSSMKNSDIHKTCIA
ncbi:hypothetical protein GOODEAATRI_000156 [Goodea atripinnis]|uniref:Uncharacterized protein n=1 Tax=Goodea atripinnis TaxID=208336 RepID=A0ABV0PA22_9TELE